MVGAGGGGGGEVGGQRGRKITRAGSGKRDAQGRGNRECKGFDFLRTVLGQCCGSIMTVLGQFYGNVTVYLPVAND